jgi:hypothetical protein
MIHPALGGLVPPAWDAGGAVRGWAAGGDLRDGAGRDSWRDLLRGGGLLGEVLANDHPHLGAG